MGSPYSESFRKSGRGLRVYPIHVAARVGDVEAVLLHYCPSLMDNMRNCANLRFLYEVT